MKKSPQQTQFEQVKSKLESLLSQMEEVLDLMPTKGDSIKVCQKTNLLMHTGDLYSCINGIELKDFTPNEYSGDFKLSYS